VRTLAPALADAVPAYGEHLAVAQLLRDDAKGASYLQFDESEPTGACEAAELRRLGIETTELLDRSTGDAERIQLVLAGRPANTHWCVDGVVVKSDWCGAQSFLVDDLGALCAGLDAEVVARIREFAARAVGSSLT
jgi:hypothetical protein